MTAPWTVTIDGLSNVGLVRERNEDAWSVGDAVYRDEGVETSRIHRRVPPVVGVWVADGMGGHGHGDVASLTALRQLGDQSATTVEQVACVLREANVVVVEQSEQDPTLAGMGTTVCGVVVTESCVLVANVGDSSVFQVDDGLLHEVSVPDRSPFGGITQCLGGGPLMEIEPHVAQLPLQESSFLLCTDGLTDMVAFEQIEEVLAGEASLAVARLVGQALAAGGVDNVTVVLVRISPSPSVPAWGGGDGG